MVAQNGATWANSRLTGLLHATTRATKPALPLLETIGVQRGTPRGSRSDGGAVRRLVTAAKNADDPVDLVKVDIHVLVGL